VLLPVELPGFLQDAINGSRGRFERYYVVGLTEYRYRSFESSFFVENTPTLNPKPNTQNVWKISLLPKMIDDARARIKQYDAGMKKNRERFQELIKKRQSRQKLDPKTPDRASPKTTRSRG
jgi:hypothetical protein